MESTVNWFAPNEGSVGAVPNHPLPATGLAGARPVQTCEAGIPSWLALLASTPGLPTSTMLLTGRCECSAVSPTTRDP